ncbi:MAG: hypothetical protein WKF96_04820 [Solirubrobacteraceae bacterium]
MTKRETWAVITAAALATAVVVVGVTIHATNGSLGVATPPFVMGWQPRIDAAGAGAALLALGALVWGAPRVLGLRSGKAFAAAAFGLALAVALAVNAARSGTLSWYEVFDLGPDGSWEAGNEIIAGLPALSYGTHFFLDRFAELVPSQPVHQAGHPPGLPVLIHLVGIDTARELAALCVVALAGVAPITFALGRALELGEDVARRAALLACASPALVLFGVTSPDAIFALVGAVAATLLCSRRAPVRAAGALVLGLGSMLSWALLAIGAWAFLVVLAREGARRAVLLAAACGAAVLAAHGGLAVLAGYDPIGTLQATGEVYRRGIASTRPYEFWVLGSPVAFLLTLGLPLAGAWVVASTRRAAPALAILAVIVASALLGFTKAEVERIWLQFAPMLCVSAALVIDDRRLRPALAVLGVQALATSLLFSTVW